MMTTENNNSNERQIPFQPSLYVKEKLQGGLHNFINHESFGGILLFFCVALAMIIANSQYKDLYFQLINMEFGYFIGNISIKINILHFVNDVLMSLFFLMIGLEMKREVLYGDLAGWKRVSFSVLTALGGMIVPIAIYLHYNYGTPSSIGFGVAMSTDTAFALGAILLLGKRIPRVVKIFLVTLAVFDDLGAILVIAILYTSNIDLFWIYIAICLIFVLVHLNYRDTKYLSRYIFVGILLWIAIYNSGIHATIAAVIVAFAIPGRSVVRRQYLAHILDILDEWKNVIKKDEVQYENKNNNFLYDFFNGIIQFFKSDKNKKINIEETSKQVHALDRISKYSRYAQNPLVKMELLLQPVCAYFIVPIFAFINAGININSEIDFYIDGILTGTVLGLVIGKPLGILLFAFIGERLNIAVVPSGLKYRHILAVGILSGVGFTMSIFVANLAYDSIDRVILSKISILIASVIAMILGIIALHFSTKQ